MDSSEPATETNQASKEEAALAALNSNAIGPNRPRRVRRRRRSLRRRLIDSLMPFAVLVGLTVLGAGIVSVVEIGAAASSKVKSTYDGESYSYEPIDTIDFEAAQRKNQNLMRRHSELKNTRAQRASQIAYQIGLVNEAERSLSGLDAVIPAPQPAVARPDDIMDWDLFEQSSVSPRSTLQRTGSRN